MTDEQFKSRLREVLASGRASLDKNYPDWDRASQNSYLIGWIESNAGLNQDEPEADND